MRVLNLEEMRATAGGPVGSNGSNSHGNQGSGNQGSNQTNTTDQRVREMCDRQGWGDDMEVTISQTDRGNVGVELSGMGYQHSSSMGTSETVTCGQVRRPGG